MQKEMCSQSHQGEDLVLLYKSIWREGYEAHTKGSIW